MRYSHIFKYIILLFTISVVVYSCKTDTPEIGEPFSKIEGLSDDWELIQLKHTDILSKVDENFVDLSASFIGVTPMRMSFKNDFTFSIAPGSSFNKFPMTNGTWAFDDNDFPTQVRLTGNGETIELQLLEPVREKVDPFFHFEWLRKYQEDCKPLEADTEGQLSYTYKFERR